MITARQIEAFHAVVSVGSMTGAARYLGRTQSAVSRLMLDLEQEVGFQLFLRAGTRLQPTENAVLLYEEVRRSFVGLRNIEARARQLAGGTTQRPIAIGATPALAGGLVPRAIARLPDARQAATVSSMTSENVVQMVAEGALDLGLASLPIDGVNIRLHWLGEAPCVAVLPEGDPLAARSTVSLSDLRDRNVLTVGNPFRLRRTIDAALKAAAIPARATLETNASLNAVMGAREGLGVAIVEPVTAYGIPVKGTVVRPIAETIPSVWGVITPQFRPVRPEVEEAVTQVGAVAAAVLPGFIRHPPEELDTLHARLFSTEPPADAE